MEENDNDWRVAMYGNVVDDDPEVDENRSLAPSAIDNGKTITIRDGNHQSFTVPSPAYVGDLERHIVDLTKKLANQERRLRALDTQLRNLGRAVKADMSDVQRQLGNKVSIRGWED